MHVGPGAAGLDEGHELALVVRGAAPADDRAVRGLLDRGIERTSVPEIERIDWLHVVVPVEEHVRGAVRRADPAGDHRAARGGAHLGLGAHAAQVRGEELGRVGAVGRMRGIGRDRRDAQERHQPPECGALLFGEAIEDRGEAGRGGHGILRVACRGACPGHRARSSGRGPLTMPQPCGVQPAAVPNPSAMGDGPPAKSTVAL